MDNFNEDDERSCEFYSNPSNWSFLQFGSIPMNNLFIRNCSIIHEMLMDITDNDNDDQPDFAHYKGSGHVKYGLKLLDNKTSRQPSQEIVNIFQSIMHEYSRDFLKYWFSRFFSTKMPKSEQDWNKFIAFVSKSDERFANKYIYYSMIRFLRRVMLKGEIVKINYSCYRALDNLDKKIEISNNSTLSEDEEEEEEGYQNVNEHGMVLKDNNNEKDVVVKLFNRFKANKWNRWHSQNYKDKRAYNIVNKRGGYGIEGDRPQIIDARDYGFTEELQEDEEEESSSQQDEYAVQFEEKNLSSSQEPQVQSITLSKYGTPNPLISLCSSPKQVCKIINLTIFFYCCKNH